MENQKKYEPARAAYEQVIAASNGETAAQAQFQIGETFLAEQKFEQAIAPFLAVEDVYAYPKWSARALLKRGGHSSSSSRWTRRRRNTTSSPSSTKTLRKQSLPRAGSSRSAVHNGRFIFRNEIGRINVTRRSLFAGCMGLLLATSVFAQDAAPPATAAATQPTASTNIPLIDLFFKGGIFMYPLAGCSILAVAIIFERMLSLRRSQVIPKNFMKGLRGVWRDPQADRQRALDYCRQKDSPIARMLAAGISACRGNCRCGKGH